LSNIATLFEFVDEKLRDLEARDLPQRNVVDIGDGSKRPGGLSCRKGAGRTTVQSV
jgi:hypothetical protein